MEARKGQAAVEKPSWASARSLRGQAAIEFLLTYGWALVALMVILIVLLGSGVLSPSFMIAQECNLGSNLPCEFNLYNDGGQTKLWLTLGNGFSYKVRLRDVVVRSTDGLQEFTFDSYSPDIDSGGTTDVKGILSGKMLQDNSIKRFTVMANYSSCAPEIIDPVTGCSVYNHTITGRLTGRVNPQK